MTIGYTVSEAWKSAAIYVKKPGAAFVPAIAAWIKVAGVWRPIIMNAFTLTASGTNWNAYTAFVQKYGVAPPSGARIDITVPAGTTVVGRSATRLTGPQNAISTTGLPTNSQVTVHVYGTVIGSAGNPGYPGSTFPAKLAEGQGQVLAVANAADRDTQPDRMLFAGNAYEFTAISAQASPAGDGFVYSKSRIKLAHSGRPDGKDGGHAIYSAFPITVKVYPGHFIAGGGGGGGGIGHARIIHCLGLPFYEEWQFAQPYINSYEAYRRSWKSTGGTFLPFAHDNTANIYWWGRETLLLGMAGTFGAGGIPQDAANYFTAGDYAETVRRYCQGMDMMPPSLIDSQLEGPEDGVIIPREMTPNTSEYAQNQPPAGYRLNIALHTLYLGDSLYYKQYTYSDTQLLASTDAQAFQFRQAAYGAGYVPTAANANGYDYAARLFLNVKAQGEGYYDPRIGNGTGGVYGTFNGPSARFSTRIGLAERSPMYIEDTSASNRVSARHRFYAGTGGGYGEDATEQSAQIFGYPGVIGNGVLPILNEAKHYSMQDYPNVFNGGYVGYGMMANFKHGTEIRPALSGQLYDLTPWMPGSVNPMSHLRTYLMNHSMPLGTGVYQEDLPIPDVSYTPRRPLRTFTFTSGSPINVDMSTVTTKKAGIVLADEFLEDRQTFNFTHVYGSALYPHPMFDYSIYTGATPTMPVQPCYMGKPGAAGKAIACAGVTLDTSAAPFNGAGAVG